MIGPYLFDHLDVGLPRVCSDETSRLSAEWIAMEDTLRILVEQGHAEIEMFWNRELRWGTCHSLLHLWGGTSATFAWASSEQRLNLLGDDLKEFYFSLALHSAYHDPAVIDIAIEKVSDLPRLAHTRIRAGCTMLHAYLSNHWSSDRRRPARLPVGAMKKVVDAGADLHALDWSGRTPLMALALAGLRSIFYIQLERYGRSMQPSGTLVESYRCHADLLAQWILFLERQNVNLTQYYKRERELGAERWINMCEDGDAGFGAMREKDQWFVRLVFEQLQPDGITEVKFDYQIVEHRIHLPGLCWG